MLGSVASHGRTPATTRWRRNDASATHLSLRIAIVMCMPADVEPLLAIMPVAVSALAAACGVVTYMRISAPRLESVAIGAAGITNRGGEA